MGEGSKVRVKEEGITSKVVVTDVTNNLTSQAEVEETKHPGHKTRKITSHWTLSQVLCLCLSVIILVGEVIRIQPSMLRITFRRHKDRSRSPGKWLRNPNLCRGK